MATTQDDRIADLQRAIAELQQERDAALAREATMAEALSTRTAELATRNSEYGEQIEHQLATVDVLNAMSESPADPQPVFVLIARHASECCHSRAVLWEFDGTLMHFRASHGAGYNMDAQEAIIHQFPAPPDRGVISARAVLERRLIHIADATEDPEIWPLLIANGARSYAAIPLMRDGKAIGAISMNSSVTGGFSESQITLLKTFAEQAVIAISSAETYRALQTRTSDLQESLEYQTATSDVLKVISRSSFDLQPVLDTLVVTAARLCGAEMASIARIEGDLFRGVASLGFPADFVTDRQTRGAFRLNPAGVTGRAVRECRAIHIHDVAADPDYPKDAITVGRQRSSLGVPLVREGDVIGVILLARQRVEPFTDRQIELVRVFADQAVIAMENARLLTEQREALEQQTATAEVLQVINASPGNLTPVFDAMLEKAMRLCDAAFGSLYTYDGERFHSAAQRGVPPAYAAFRAQNPPLLTPGGGPATLLETRRPSQVLDLRAHETNRTDYPGVQAMVELGGIRTILMVPLLKEEAFLGYISIFRQEVRAFADKQITLLENFAAQAVIAMENARLITETREALEQQTATAEVLQVINASPGNLTPVFEAILEKAHDLCDIAYGDLQLYDGEHLYSVAQRGLSAEFSDRLRQGYRASDSPASRPLLAGSRFTHITDVAAVDFMVFRSAVRPAGIRTVLFVPLRKDGSLLGMIASARKEVRPFTEREISLLENFAAQAVIAMENARLINEQREALEQQTATAEVLQVINASPGDLTPVFEAMLEKAMRLCEAAFGSLYTYDGERFHSAAQRGVPPAYAAFRAEHPPAPRPGAGIAMLLETRKPLQTVDMMADELYQAGDPGVRAMVDLGGIRTILAVPLCKDEAVLGLITVYRQEVREFSDKQIALLENFAAQAVIAMENARLIDEIRAARDAAEEASRTIEVAFRELKAAQANLIQAEKMASLGQLTAGIAHEIKNPLNFVNNFAALSVDLLSELKETAAPGFAALTDDQRADIDNVSAMLTSNLEKINEHGKRADGIVKAMLEHSRGSSAERRMVDLNALIDEALNLGYHGARAQDQSFNITLVRDFGEDIAPIEVNPQDMTRVFLNIFSNGFYAATRRTRNGGDTGFVPMLKVTTRDAGDVVEVRVRDNGTGIPAEIKDKLFQPFFTTKPTGEGTGLGLSITYDIVTKQHGGTITVESEVNQFTEFVVTLPRKMFGTEGDRA